MLRAVEVVPVEPARGLQDLNESLGSVHDLLQGADRLLAGEVSPACGRSARALLALAADLVAQSADLARALAR